MKIIYFLFILLFVTVNSLFAAVEKNYGFVKKIIGRSEIAKNGSESWNSIKKTMKIETSDKLKTGRGSELTIEFCDKSYITLKENTEIRFDELQITEIAVDTNIRYIKIFMQYGNINSDIKKNSAESKIFVHTPLAICEVHGALFNLEQKNDATLKVLNGIVDIYRIEGKDTDYKLVDMQKAVISQTESGPAAVTVCDTKDLTVFTAEEKNKVGKKPSIISGKCKISNETPEGVEYDFNLVLKNIPDNLKAYIVVFDASGAEVDYYFLNSSTIPKNENDEVLYNSKFVVRNPEKFKYRFLVEYE